MAEIVGAALCVVTGFSLAMALQLSAGDADAGDWLTAAGSALGVMLTIAAAVFIEEYRSKSSERAAIGRVESVLRSVRRTAEAVRDRYYEECRSEPRTTAAEREALRFRQREAGLRDARALTQAIRKYSFVRERTEINDPELWEALSRLDEAMSINQTGLDGVSSTLLGASDDDIAIENRRRAGEAALHMLTSVAYGLKAIARARAAL